MFPTSSNKSSSKTPTSTSRNCSFTSQ
jgi:hypothetical protein